MALVNVSNATFDAALALVPAPFGPLARAAGVDLDALPRVEPNSMTQYLVDAQGPVQLYISYEELTTPDVLNQKLRKAFGIAYRFREAQVLVEALNYLLQEVDVLTLTAEEYQEYMALFQYLVPITGHLNPKFNYSELSKSNEVDASFTVSTAPSAAHRTVVNTSTGLISRYVWDWGDGELSFEEDPAPHAYAVDGTYVIRLFAFGAGGVDIYEDSETVNVP
jgi:hypothetical protein